MPGYEFECEVCGKWRKATRTKKQKPPRFCSRACKVKGMRGRKIKQKYTITPEMHARIQKVYQRDSGNGQIAALARALDLPRWKVTKYAQRQGWLAKQPKEPDWSEAETELLIKLARYSPPVIARKMKERGFRRSETGIILKMRRINARKNIAGHSSRDVAKCLGVDDHFVTRAIRLGKLRATRRGTARTEAQGGDMWYILERSIKEYVLENLNEIDIRKVDKHWFVDILTGRAA